MKAAVIGAGFIVRDCHLVAYQQAEALVVEHGFAGVALDAPFARRDVGHLAGGRHVASLAMNDPGLLTPAP